jgi:hypothetical protein
MYVCMYVCMYICMYMNYIYRLTGLLIGQAYKWAYADSADSALSRPASRPADSGWFCWQACQPMLTGLLIGQIYKILQMSLCWLNWLSRPVSLCCQLKLHSLYFCCISGLSVGLSAYASSSSTGLLIGQIYKICRRRQGGQYLLYM